MERRAARHAARDRRRRGPSQSRAHSRRQPRLLTIAWSPRAGRSARHHLVSPLSFQRLHPRAPLRPVAAIVSRVVRGLPQRHRGGGGSGAPGATARLLHDGARTRLVVGDRGQHLRRRSSSVWRTWRRSCCCPLLFVHPVATRRTPARLERLAHAPGHASSAYTSGRSAPRPGKPMRRSPASARRGASWCRTRCWSSTATTKSKSCWRTSSVITFITTSGAPGARNHADSAGVLRRRHHIRSLAAALGLEGLTDPAGVPLLIAAAGAVSLMLMPFGLALSRRHERRADRFALDLTSNPGAFVSAMRRLGAQNLAEDRPSRLVSGCSTAIRRWRSGSRPPAPGHRAGRPEVRSLFRPSFFVPRPSFLSARHVAFGFEARSHAQHLVHGLRAHLFAHVQMLALFTKRARTPTGQTVYHLEADVDGIEP